MCGIAGAVANIGWKAPSREIVRRMCDAIRHRGPDDEGIFHNGRAALGMRRLAIIDPHGGRQPIQSEDGLVTVVGNGEIYNYRDLRRRLEYRGHRFTTGSDIECAVHAYEEFGTECFKEMRGMFALAIWDEGRHRLVLARDRFGKKPLFYREGREGLAFASELKSLCRLENFNNTLRSDAVCNFMLYGYVPTPASIFEQVKKLPPACSLTYESGSIRVERYWSLSHSPKMDKPEEELVDMLDDRINSAVVARLVSDVPFGAFLSGGIDSSLVVAIMSRHLTNPVKTFSIGFDDTALDESEDARRVARYIGTEHHELRATANIAERIERIVWHLDEPLADSSALPSFMVSELAARHVKMVLSGDGGDEIFAGYDRYQKYRQLARLKRLGAGRVMDMLDFAGGWLPGHQRQRFNRLRKRFSHEAPDDYISGVALLSPAELQTLLLHPPRMTDSYRHLHRHFAPGVDGMGELDRLLLGDMQSYLLDDVLAKVDRMSMANSIEVRSPLLDHLLAEFAARLPEQLKLNGKTGKYLLKRVAMRYLPAETVKKRKQGFAIPLGRWMRADLREMLLDILGSRAFVERGIFNVAHVQTLAKEHIASTADHAETLWSVLIFELWAREFLKPVRSGEKETRIPPAEAGMGLPPGARTEQRPPI